MKSIILMIPYFGKLPQFYEAWKITAMHNSTIHFLLFTDDKTVKSEGNIRVVHLEWQEMVSKIQAFFPFPIALRAPYKICDFRPAFGEIFCDCINGYDYWGYCDIDLLFGDIRKFITDELLQEYDRFFYNGHVSIYKNCEKMNQLYRYIEEEGYPAVNYEECYRSPRAFYFDEFGAMYAKCLINKVKVFDDLKIRRDPIIGKEKFYWENVEEESQFVISWEKGRLYAVHRGQKTELLYAHFFRRKFSVPEKTESVERIVIAPRELRYNSDVTEQDFEKSEAAHYARLYFWNALKGTLKHNGMKGTFEKRKRDRDYWAYRRKLEKQS